MSSSLGLGCGADLQKYSCVPGHVPPDVKRVELHLGLCDLAKACWILEDRGSALLRQSLSLITCVWSMPVEVGGCSQAKAEAAIK
jgi:hypothetical protein